MDQDDKSLVKDMVDKDEYFKEARHWYNVKYQSPIVEKAYSVILTLIAVFSTIFSVWGFTGLLPVETEVSFVIITPKIENDIVTMRPIGKENMQTDVALMRHFVHEYITVRESYDVRVIEQQMNRIRALSDSKSFRAYRTMMATSNPQSPITLYESHTERVLSAPEQRRLTLWYAAEDGTKAEPPENAWPNRATVEYTATITSPESASRSRWISEIHFNYSPVIVDQDTFEVTPMDFLVTQYNVEKKRTTAK